MFGVDFGGTDKLLQFRRFVRGNMLALTFYRSARKASERNEQTTEQKSRGQTKSFFEIGKVKRSVLLCFFEFLHTIKIVRELSRYTPTRPTIQSKRARYRCKLGRFHVVFDFNCIELHDARAVRQELCAMLELSQSQRHSIACFHTLSGLQRRQSF